MNTQTRTRHFSVDLNDDGSGVLEIWHLDDPRTMPHERWPMTRDDLRALAGLITGTLDAEAAFDETVARYETVMDTNPKNVTVTATVDSTPLTYKVADGVNAKPAGLWVTRVRRAYRSGIPVMA